MVRTRCMPADLQSQQTMGHLHIVAECSHEVCISENGGFRRHAKQVHAFYIGMYSLITSLSHPLHHSFTFPSYSSPLPPSLLHSLHPPPHYPPPAHFLIFPHSPTHLIPHSLTHPPPSIPPSLTASPTPSLLPSCQ